MLVYREVHLLVESLNQNRVPMLVVQEAAQGDGRVAVAETQLGIS